MSDLRRHLDTWDLIQENFAKEDRQLAKDVYLLLLEIERWTFPIPSAIGMLFVLLGGLAAIWLDPPVLSDKALMILLPLIYSAVCWLAGFSLAKPVCNRFRSSALHRLRNFQLSDRRFNPTLDELEILDSRIFKNINLEIV